MQIDLTWVKTVLNQLDRELNDAKKDEDIKREKKLHVALYYINCALRVLQEDYRVDELDLEETGFSLERN